MPYLYANMPPTQVWDYLLPFNITGYKYRTKNQYNNEHYNKTSAQKQTHFKRFVEHAEAPSTLPSTFNNPHAELVFCVRSEVINVNIKVGSISHLLSSAGGTAAGPTAQLVPDCVYTIVVDSLASTEAAVGPHYDDRCW